MATVHEYGVRESQQVVVQSTLRVEHILRAGLTFERLFGEESLQKLRIKDGYHALALF